jgi:hypothetical protein
MASAEADTAVSYSPLKRLRRSHRDREILKKNFNNIIYTHKGSFLHKTTSEKVWLPPRKLLPWAHIDRGSSFRGLIETSESFDTAEAFAKTNIGSQFI